APTALEHFEGQRPFRGRGADELPRRDATNQRALFRSDRSHVPWSKAITARTWSALVLLKEDHASSHACVHKRKLNRKADLNRVGMFQISNKLLHQEDRSLDHAPSEVRTGIHQFDDGEGFVF